MKEVIRNAIIDGDGGNKLLSIVESVLFPGKYGAVVTNPDGSSISDGVYIKDEHGDIVGKQTPLQVDGDSVYDVDIDWDNSSVVDWTGDATQLFKSPFSASITNTTTTNPKQIILSFCRTIKAQQIGFGENNGGDFSNTKVSLLGSGGTVRAIFDDSANNTKKTSLNVEFEDELFNSILIEFYTTDEVNLSNVTIQKARYNTTQILGRDPGGEFKNANVTYDGNLAISDQSDGLAISKGDVAGTTFVHKFGQASDFDFVDGQVDIRDGANDATIDQMQYVFSTTAIIDTISSSSAADVEAVQIQGLDENYNLVVQQVTLNGQTKVTLPTPLIRTFRGKNNGFDALTGIVYVYEDTAITGGVPNDTTKIKLAIDDGNNQTLMAIYTVPNGKTGYMRDWYAALSGARKETGYIIRLWAREYDTPTGQHNSWQLKHISSISEGGTSNIQHKYTEPERFGARTDLRMTAQMTVNTTGGAISAGFDIVLVDDI